MKRIAAVIVAGAGFGVAIRLSWTLPAEELDWLPRVAWPWLLAAFAAGATTPDGRRAAIDGALLLCSATVAYYAFEWLAIGAYHYSPVGVWWLLIAAPAGVLAGMAGSATRWGPGRLKALAVGLFAILVVAEAFGTTHEVTRALHDLRSGAHGLAD